jgi:tryptophan-rich sensory protein
VSISLLTFIAVNFAAALSGALFPRRQWYRALAKPSWQPPDWAFAPVWMVLFALNAIAGWLVWTTAAPGAAVLPMVVYAIQLILNAAWSALFFGLRQMRWALIECAGLWASVLATLLVFWPVSPLAGALIIPYLAWVSVAFYLNYTLIRLNPNASGQPEPAARVVESRA